MLKELRKRHALTEAQRLGPGGRISEILSLRRETVISIQNIIGSRDIQTTMDVCSGATKEKEIESFARPEEKCPSRSPEFNIGFMPPLHPLMV